jgi:uncharacterized secreted protein with C-terminal beta-propeller domain
MKHSKRTLGLLASAAVSALATQDGRAVAATGIDPCRQMITQQIQNQLTYRRTLAEQRERSRSQEAEKNRALDGDVMSARGPSPAPAIEPTAIEPTARPAEKKPAPQASRRTADENASKSDSGPKHYSRTNIQEESVDEGDIVKTDGRHIYHVSCRQTGAASACRNELRIFKSWPISDARLLGRYEIPMRSTAPHVQQIYLYRDSIAVILGEHFDGPATRVLLLDVEKPSAPRLAREFAVDGTFVDSRLIGSRLYLATTTPGLQIPPAMMTDVQALIARIPDDEIRSSTMSADAILSELEDKWAHVIRDPKLPRAREWLSGNREASGPIYGCSDVVVDPANQGQSLLNLSQIDLASSDPVTGAGVAGYSAQSKVYASEAAFYVADPIAPSTAGWSSASSIRSFDLSKGGKPRFASRAMVRGHLLNQFSMSEHAGHLRVATSDHWASNNVYVLDTAGDELRIVGSVENIARNERIFAVRMMGPKGYVVTFRRTDPLFTLDLSDPKNPRVVGELHVQGFSNYLHPLDDDHLLAIGQDADASGRTLGFHLQIFDVRDPSRPTRTHHQKLEAASASIAQNDHHAFMFEPSTKTLALPWQGQNYWGLIAYRVDAERGFSDLGRVNHALMYQQLHRKRCRGSERGICGERNGWWKMFTRQDLAIDRVVAIEDHLFSFSPSGVMVHQAGRRLTQRAAMLVNEPAERQLATAVATR